MTFFDTSPSWDINCTSNKLHDDLFSALPAVKKSQKVKKKRKELVLSDLSPLSPSPEKLHSKKLEKIASKRKAYKEKKKHLLQEKKKQCEEKLEEKKIGAKPQKKTKSLGIKQFKDTVETNRDETISFNIETVNKKSKKGGKSPFKKLKATGKKVTDETSSVQPQSDIVTLNKKSEKRERNKYKHLAGKKKYSSPKMEQHANKPYKLSYSPEVILINSSSGEAKNKAHKERTNASELTNMDPSSVVVGKKKKKMKRKKDKTIELKKQTLEKINNSSGEEKIKACKQRKTSESEMTDKGPSCGVVVGKKMKKKKDKTIELKQTMETINPSSGEEKIKEHKWRKSSESETTNMDPSSVVVFGKKKKKMKKKKDKVNEPKQTLESINHSSGEAKIKARKRRKSSESETADTDPSSVVSKKKRKKEAIETKQTLETIIHSSGDEKIKAYKQRKTSESEMTDMDPSWSVVVSKKKKKMKRKNDMIVEPKQALKSPSNKSPFNINKLRSILENKPLDTNNQTGDKKDKSKQKKKTMTKISDKKETEKITEMKKAKASMEVTKSLNERMKSQLKSARFRFLNQQLYTTSSYEAKNLFNDDPDSFQVYHEGFQSQVDKWPVNPNNRVIDYIKARPKSLIIADFGCGDAKLAQAVPHCVHSFDLVAVNQHVTACDISDVPLENKSIDIGVFCLSLMGTNLADFILEANRVLKPGGKLLIAEVVSRFENIGSFVRKLSKFGFARMNKDDENKMFVWLEFIKSSDVKKSGLPQLDLMPCMYKKR